LKLTIDSLKENIEDAVSRNRKLVSIQESVLNALLIMLVAIEVVLLQVVEETTCDGSDAFDVHLRRGELLFAVLYCILQIFQGKNEL